MGMEVNNNFQRERWGGYPTQQLQEAAIAAGGTGILVNDQNSSSQTTFQPNTGNQYQSQMDGYSNLAGLDLGTSGQNSDAGYTNSILDNIKNTNILNSQNTLMSGGSSKRYSRGGNYKPPAAELSFKDKYLNADFLGGAGSVLKGFGSLASGWAAMKNLKLTKEAMDTQQNQWQTNFDAQSLATNNQISNQNAWKQAQGRTDYGSYVGGKPAGTNYVG